MLRTIPIEEIYDSLNLENPWWRSRSIPDRVANFPERSYLPAFLQLTQQTDTVRTVVLLGPRRVGKTVMALQVVGRLLKEVADPRHIVFISLDRPLYNGLTLERLVQYHLDQIGNPTNRTYFFFDEIQYVRDWERELKSLTDLYPHIRFVASGSAAAALRAKSTESGAGRFTDFFLPPLTFDEFVRFQPETNGSLDRLNGYADDGFERHADLADLDIAYLNILFERYINHGGYPEAVFSANVRENMDRFIREDIVEKVLLRDLPSLYGIQDTRELNSLFTTLCYNTAQEVSLEGLSRTAAVSKNTIKRYLEYLEAAFLVRQVTRIDQTAAHFQRQTTFKVYLTNPSLRSALFRPIGPDESDFGAMAETAIFSQWFHGTDRNDLHYARWDKGEIDIVSLYDLKPNWFVEVKWSDRHVNRSGELAAVDEFIRRHAQVLEGCTVTTKTKFATIAKAGKTIELLPAAVYCWQVGRNILAWRPYEQAEFDF